MLTTSIIDVERNYNSSFNVIMASGHIPCFNFVTRMLYIWKIKYYKNYNVKNGSYKWSTKCNLRAFFGWNVTENFLSVL